MKIFLSLFLVIITASIGFAQNSNTSINHGRILFSDATNIDAYYLVIKQDSVLYYEKNSQVLHIVGLNEIKEIQEYRGNFSTTGILVGGLVGTGIGVVIALGTKDTEKDEGYFITTETTTIQTWPIYAGALVGTLIGGLIGGATEDWKTVYSNKTAFINNLKFSINNNKRGICFNCRLNF